MKLTLCLWMCLLSLSVSLFAQDLVLSQGEGETVVTSIVSNVSISKGWRRSFVIGEEGGTLKDASGKIADYQSGKAVEEAAAMLPLIVESANQGLTNALSSLYAVTNNIGSFTDRIYIAGDLEADGERDNWWCYIANEGFDGSDDVMWVWFSEDLPSPPRMIFQYLTEGIDIEVEASWELPWINNHYDIGNFRNCRKCTVHRPAEIGRICMRVNAYPRMGGHGNPFDFARKGFFLTDETHSVTNLPWSGTWTNSLGQVLQWNNGIFVGEAAQ